jgi:hypothetical protein
MAPKKKPIYVSYHLETDECGLPRLHRREVDLSFAYALCQDSSFFDERGLEQPLIKLGDFGEVQIIVRADVPPERVMTQLTTLTTLMRAAHDRTDLASA